MVNQIGCISNYQLANILNTTAALNHANLWTKVINITHIVKTSWAAEDQLIAVGLQDRAVDISLQLLVGTDADSLKTISSFEDLLWDSMETGGNLLELE